MSATQTAVKTSLEHGEEAIQLSDFETGRASKDNAARLPSMEQETASAARSVHADNAEASLPASLRAGSASSARASSSASLAREAAASALPPVDRGRQAWTFLLSAMVLEVLIWGLGNASGTFQDYHLSSPQSPLYGAPSSVSAATSTLITAGQYFAPFLFLGYLSAFPRHITRFSGLTLLISVLGLVGASLHPSPSSVVALQGFLSGWAGGAFYTPAMLWLPQWFDERRGLATGVLFLGSGVGGVMWPFVISGLLQKVGFSWTLRVLALFQGILGACIFYFMRPRIAISSSAPASDAGGTLITDHRRRRNVLRAVLPVHDKMMQTPLGIANATLQFCQGAAFWSISYYISPYATSLGFSRATSTALLSVLNAASAFSYVFTGRLCDSVPYAPLIIILSTVGSLLVGVGLGFARSLPGLFVFASLYGLANGGFSTCMSPAAREMAILGQTEHSAIFVEIMAMRGLGGVFGPLISSVLYKGSATKGAESSGSSQDSLWSANAVYGSHGMGSIVIFATLLCLIVSLAATATIPMRKQQRFGRAFRPEAAR